MQPERTACHAAHTGVVLLGGAHGALALARSFGRNGIPVVLVTDDHPLPKFSRYVQRRFDWPGANAPSRRAGWFSSPSAKACATGCWFPAATAKSS